MYPFYGKEDVFFLDDFLFFFRVFVFLGVDKGQSPLSHYNKFCD